MRLRRLLLPLAASAALAGMAAGPAAATHSWGGYHWARTANPFTLKLGDNVNGAWDSYLVTTSSDWTASTVLDTMIVAGGTTGRRCRATAGRVEVCNSTYGANGWLGLASVWANGGHITQGTVKVNDTYFNTSTYNKPEWRNLVMCQEVGHTLGLDHQDEIQTNANLGTCMDYTNDPKGVAANGPLRNESPNQHDYDQLLAIYAHLDATTTVSQTAPNAAAAAGAGNSQAEWGQAIRYSGDGRPSLFVRDAGNGEQVFTFVIWAG